MDLNPGAKFCKGCYYWKSTTRNVSGYYCCHYILVEGEPRGCKPGENCEKRLELSAEETEIKDTEYRKKAVNWSSEYTGGDY